jgi:hypothetical protein
MNATVLADIRIGKVYRVPFSTLTDARRYVRGAHKPYRGVILVDGREPELWQDGKRIDTDEL